MSDINLSNIRKMDGALLLVFRELLRCKNATEAANRLALSQSAVSHSLARLRDLFDDQLFLRRPHGFAPTRKAIELGPKVEALISLASETIGDQGEFDPAATDRRFVFSAPEYLTAQIGASLLQTLSRFAPDASFWCHYLPQQEAFNALWRGDIDLAVGRYENLDLTNISIERLYRDEYCVAASRDNPHIKDRISKKQFFEMEYVFAGSQSELTQSEIQADYSEFKMAAIVPHWLTALSIVATTNALTICPKRLALGQAKSLGLKVLKHPFESMTFELFIAKRRGDNDAGIIWFSDKIKHLSNS